MSAGYPVEIDLSRVRVLVVGGGRVAARKIAGLAAAGGRPVVIAPRLVGELEAMEAAGEIVPERREYREGDEEGFGLVFAATDDPELNARIEARGRRRGALVNVVNVPGASSFRVPAVLRRGPLTIACSTGGASPLLARRIRDRIGEVVGAGAGRGAARLAALRGEIRQHWPEEEEHRRGFWFDLFSDDFLDALLQGRDEEVESMIQRCLSRSSA